MRSLFVLMMVASALAATTAQEERRVPSDSSRITIPGCARDRSFIVDVPQGREVTATIPPGRRFRLSGPRELLDDIRKREATMVEITGLVRKSDLAGPGGIKLLGGRIRIGGTAPRDSMRDPMYNQIVIDVESFQLLPDRCPDR